MAVIMAVTGCSCSNSIPIPIAIAAAIAAAAVAAGSSKLSVPFDGGLFLPPVPDLPEPGAARELLPSISESA
jgi:hypothetical protein